ncbi:protein containing Restriction endonuclease, type I, EcoEI, R subunit/Type III, Res subunit, partial [human gut metagenome]
FRLGTGSSECAVGQIHEQGIQDIENLEILSNDPFRKFGTPMKIAKLFGGKNGYIQAIRDLQKEIYAA